MEESEEIQFPNSALKPSVHVKISVYITYLDQGISSLAPDAIVIIRDQNGLRQRTRHNGGRLLR